MNLKTFFCPQIMQIMQINADFKAHAGVRCITLIASWLLKVVCFLICGNLRNLRIKVFPEINLALQEVRS